MNIFVSIYEKIVNTLGKLASPFILGVLIGIVSQYFSRMANAVHARRKMISDGRRRTRLILKNNNKLFTRDEILEIGRKAVKCRISNKLLKNCVVGKDGYSYEKDQYTFPDGYENRLLNEFIGKAKDYYKF